ERYLSKVYNDEWLRENQILEVERIAVARLLDAKNSGAPPLISVAPTATVRQALNLMSTYNVSQLPVLDGGDGVGRVQGRRLRGRWRSPARRKSSRRCAAGDTRFTSWTRSPGCSRRRTSNGSSPGAWGASRPPWPSSTNASASCSPTASPPSPP